MDKQLLEKFTLVALHAIMSNPKHGSESVEARAVAMVAVETAAAAIDEMEIALGSRKPPFFIFNKLTRQHMIDASGKPFKFMNYLAAEAYVNSFMLDNPDLKLIVVNK